MSQVRFRALSRHLNTKFRFSDYLGVLYRNVGLIWDDVRGITKQALDVERNVYQDYSSNGPYSVPQQQEPLTLETFDSKSATALDEKEDEHVLSGLPTDTVMRKEANAHRTSSNHQLVHRTY